jgi:hypothetical protein
MTLKIAITTEAELEAAAEAFPAVVSELRRLRALLCVADDLIHRRQPFTLEQIEELEGEARAIREEARAARDRV